MGGKKEKQPNALLPEIDVQQTLTPLEAQGEKTFIPTDKPGSTRGMENL